MLAAGHPAQAQHKPKRFPSEDEKLAAVGEPVSIAQATWNTGWAQAEVFKKLLKELGYAVNQPKTIDNLGFYLTAARGEMDLRANSWFPSHQPLIEEVRVRGKVAAIVFDAPVLQHHACTSGKGFVLHQILRHVSISEFREI